MNGLTFSSHSPIWNSVYFKNHFNLPGLLVCFTELAAKGSLTDSARADKISSVLGNSGRLGGDTREDSAVLEPNVTVFDEASEILDEVDVLTAGTLRLPASADLIECGTGTGNSGKFCLDPATVLIIDEFTGFGKLRNVEVLGATPNPLVWPAETGFGKDGPLWGIAPAKLGDGNTGGLWDEFAETGKGSWVTLWDGLKIIDNYLEKNK